MKMESIRKGEPRRLKADLGSDLHPKKRQQRWKEELGGSESEHRKNEQSQLKFKRLIGSALDC